MGSLAFRQQVSADMFAGLKDAGMADDGTYTPPGVGQTPIPCTVVINRGEAPLGTFGTVPGGKTTIRLLLEEVPTPVRGGIIAADGGSFVLVKELSNDGALAMWDAS